MTYGVFKGVALIDRNVDIGVQSNIPTNPLIILMQGKLSVCHIRLEPGLSHSDEMNCIIYILFILDNIGFKILNFSSD